MMLRRPIRYGWRIALGAVGILLVLGMYTVLAQQRQAERRAAQRENAVQRLELLDQQLERLPTASPGAADPAAEQRARLEKTRRELLEDRDHPDEVDRTVPTIPVLIRDGLWRAITPQGELKRKEVWLWIDSKATLSRLVVGLGAAVLLSVALGLLMGCYDAVDAFFLPTLAFAAKIPPTAMLAVFFVLVGTNFNMYIVMLVFGVLPTLAQSISHCVRKDVPEELIFKAYTLGASQVELIWNVIYKQILPRIIDAIRLQIGPALVLLLAAEWMVADAGFGYRLRLFYQRTDMTVVYVYLILLGLGGLAADTVLTRLRRRICPWFGS